MHRRPFGIAAFLVFVTATCAFAVSLLPVTPEQQGEAATAIFRGTVLQLSSFRSEADGAIHTRAIFRVDEALKGKFASNVQVVYRGGILDGEGEVDSSSPWLLTGQECVLFLGRHADGALSLLNGRASCIVLARQENGDFDNAEIALLQAIRQMFPNPAAAGEDVSDQGVKNVTVSSNVIGGFFENSGVPSRFIAPDRGEAIPYLVDAQTLPAGITTEQALNAVSNAFRAWSQVSSVQFVYEGMTNFGTASGSVTNTDRKIRVQLHDLHNFITEASVLGKGGRGIVIPGAFPNGGNGGKVGAREFFESTRGYVVLEHTASSMQNIATFTEVLCHEIGHVLSLDHSSETPGEANTTLREAMMYFQVHADGRAATLGAYDPPLIRQAFPTNTPPFVFNRVIDMVSGPTTPNVAGINEIELRGYDLQNDSLSFITTNATANNGAFSVQGNKLKMTPAGYFGDGPRFDPAGNSYYDRVYVRFFDASNASPFMLVKVISIMTDAQSDGLPDTWATQYFGSSTPSAASKTQAQDDFDNDGVSNLNEFISGTNPADATSLIKVSTVSTTNLQWIAKDYDLYEVQQSTNLSSWTRATTPVLTTTNSGTINLTNSAPHQFFRIERVP